ncbi:MAG: inositol monophosphatase [Candidatus Omnitrophica bacterium CG11_big_fil_rev_8_21_14_0_20_42_13]|uniref:Inositol-1-monophosphatase n=1 Tax=Candidatus Ghiorseimicrobium undicola TaxID=1974746 RepID=A0A2H0LZD3_9BACT|nr:MAG: inositol monophosphatase [Candidatus Omnitrophica bacterium CG11_big_fil_rev_8_21_14_0_20_42_13]
MSKDFLRTAISAARQAGAVHKKYFNTKFKIRKKSTSFDLVTVADIEAEKKIVSVIKNNFKGHNFLCEENKYAPRESEYTWIIDPLDGTNNFASGLPIFSASVALAKKDQLIAGAVYDVTRDELFYAQKGKGAYLNGRKISVKKISNLQEALLITGFYYDRGREMFENLEKIKQFFLKRIIGLRRLGSAALDLCYVASGRAGGYWEFELSPWDFAAGALIVSEAGGKVTARHGEKFPLGKSPIVASNGLLHKKMLKIINS